MMMSIGGSQDVSHTGEPIFSSHRRTTLSYIVSSGKPKDMIFYVNDYMDLLCFYLAFSVKRNIYIKELIFYFRIKLHFCSKYTLKYNSTSETLKITNNNQICDCYKRELT